MIEIKLKIKDEQGQEYITIPLECYKNNVEIYNKNTCKFTQEFKNFIKDQVFLLLPEATK